MPTILAFTIWYPYGLPWWLSSKVSACQWETRVQSLSWEDPLEKEMATTPVFLPREFHGQRTWWAIVHGVAESRTQVKSN